MNNRMLGIILIIIALFKIVLSLFILGNLLSGIFLLIATDLTFIDLVVGILVLLVGLHLIRK